MWFTLVCSVPPGVGDGVGVGVGVAPALLVVAAAPLPAHPAIARTAIASRAARAKVRCVYVIWDPTWYGISWRVAMAFFELRESWMCRYSAALAPVFTNI